MLRRFLDTFGFEYEFVSATDFYRSGRFDAVLRRAAERYDAIMAVMLALAARRAAADLLDLPADLAAVGAGALRAAEGGERRRGDDHLRRRGRDGDDAAGHRRQREAAVEAGLRRALGGARRRLRDVRQGPLDQHADLRLHLRDPRRAGAGAFHLRAFPRREGGEDLEVEGERADHRRVAELCEPGEPRLLHVRQAEDGEAALFRRDPEERGRVPPAAARLCRARMRRRGWPTRSGTSTAASRRRATWW